MPAFAYKGRNDHGDLVEGVLESSDSAGVADQLVNNSITPIDIKLVAVSESDAAMKGLGKFFKPTIKPADLVLFTRQLHTLLKAGVPILRALSGLRESTLNPALAEVIQSLQEGLENGRELSSAMRQHPKVFSPFYISMVRVGETTGMLEQVLTRIFVYLEFERHTREQVKATLRYPTFVMIAMVVAIGVINIWVIPAFSKVYAGIKTELPAMTKILIASSNFTIHYWPLLIAIIAGIIFGFKMWTRSRRGKYRWDKIKLHLPVAGPIIEKITLERFSRSFALASKSGIPIVQAFSIVAQVVDNEYIAQRVSQMRDGIERGETVLRTAVTAGVFTPVVLQMIAVGEETGELENLMEDIAEMYEREVDYDIKNLSSKIEPILITVLGVIILILALGVFMPIWDLGKNSMGK